MSHGSLPDPHLFPMHITLSANWAQHMSIIQEQFTSMLMIFKHA